MYRYDDYDRAIVTARVAQFRDQTRRFLAGTLPADEFRPLRLQNGLYVEKNGPMLRIAVPYGVLSAQQLRKLAAVTRRYDRGVGHFTTRHNLQLNWVKIEEVPDILAELAEVDMHAIQTSGNDIRNIVTDHFAGVADDELADTRPWAELLRQWSTLHPEFAYLPKKFKIGITAAREDRAAIRVNDVGLELRQDANGATGFRVFVGGGLGRTPLVGQAIRDFLPWPHLVTYLEAVLRVYNRYGRRDNTTKARIKILVKSLGAVEFARQVEEEWSHLKDGPATLTQAEVDRVAAHFAPPAYENLPAEDLCYVGFLREDAAFARWAARSVHAHKVPGYAAVTLSLKGLRAAPGDATAEQLEAAADIAEHFSFNEVRVSHEQNLVLPHVPLRELYTVWHLAKAVRLASPVTGLVGDIIACPGGDFCELANARSLNVVAELQERFENLHLQHEIGELDINISGCMNACGHHHIGHIGILGVDKHGAEFYQVALGGRQGHGLAFGEVVGPAFAADEVGDAVERIVGVYLEHRLGHERFIDTFDRIGLAPFRSAAYQQTEQEKIYA
ncbi:MAG: nitrite/sulfite reductase [Rhodocyclales bacterium]|nr:nitrite/sulfite reductase [Rhodocyclales bacterium]